jgi:protein TonB
MVQQARLIQSMPPAYPALARANRVSGDVLLDALIDASGKVTDVKVISGPVLLQQAAIETVRHWKYEPARLDEQAVAMHLTVTVKFHLN